jgi:hypothetical protein
MSTTPQNTLQDKPYTVEYYYKAAWGYADEFIRLYKKNHYPILKRQMEMGRILKMKLVKPRFHTTEDGRWDWRVTIVWKNIQMTDDGFSEEDVSRQLFTDQETFKKEEQRRFEMLIGHWDIPITDVELDNEK